MSEINFFKEVVEEVSNRFKNSNLGKLAEINKTNLNDYDAPIIQELNPPIKNKQDGLRREKEVEDELKKKYPEEEGYEIIPEAYLRDEEVLVVVSQYGVVACRGFEIVVFECL